MAQSQQGYKSQLESVANTAGQAILRAKLPFSSGLRSVFISCTKRRRASHGIEPVVPCLAVRAQPPFTLSLPLLYRNLK
jgi:hypothetical protein